MKVNKLLKGLVIGALAVTIVGGFLPAITGLDLFKNEIVRADPDYIDITGDTTISEKAAYRLACDGAKIKFSGLGSEQITLNMNGHSCTAESLSRNNIGGLQLTSTDNKSTFTCAGGNIDVPLTITNVTLKFTSSVTNCSLDPCEGSIININGNLSLSDNIIYCSGATVNVSGTTTLTGSGLISLGNTSSFTTKDLVLNTPNKTDCFNFRDNKSSLRVENNLSVKSDAEFKDFAMIDTKTISIDAQKTLTLDGTKCFIDVTTDSVTLSNTQSSLYLNGGATAEFHNLTISNQAVLDVSEDSTCCAELVTAGDWGTVRLNGSSLRSDLTVNGNGLIDSKDSLIEGFVKIGSVKNNTFDNTTVKYDIDIIKCGTANEDFKAVITNGSVVEGKLNINDFKCDVTITDSTVNDIIYSVSTNYRVVRANKSTVKGDISVTGYDSYCELSSTVVEKNLTLDNTAICTLADIAINGKLTIKNIERVPHAIVITPNNGSDDLCPNTIGSIKINYPEEGESSDMPEVLVEITKNYTVGDVRMGNHVTFVAADSTFKSIVEGDYDRDLGSQTVTNLTNCTITSKLELHGNAHANLTDGLIKGNIETTNGTVKYTAKNTNKMQVNGKIILDIDSVLRLQDCTDLSCGGLEITNSFIEGLSGTLRVNGNMLIDCSTSASLEGLTFNKMTVTSNLVIRDADLTFTCPSVTVGSIEVYDVNDYKPKTSVVFKGTDAAIKVTNAVNVHDSGYLHIGDEDTRVSSFTSKSVTVGGNSEVSLFADKATIGLSSFDSTKDSVVVSGEGAKLSVSDCDITVNGTLKASDKGVVAINNSTSKVGITGNVWLTGSSKLTLNVADSSEIVTIGNQLYVDGAALELRTGNNQSTLIDTCLVKGQITMKNTDDVVLHNTTSLGDITLYDVYGYFENIKTNGKLQVYGPLSGRTDKTFTFYDKLFVADGMTVKFANVRIDTMVKSKVNIYGGLSLTESECTIVSGYVSGGVDVISSKLFCHDGELEIVGDVDLTMAEKESAEAPLIAFTNLMHTKNKKFIKGNLTLCDGASATLTATDVTGSITGNALATFKIIGDSKIGATAGSKVVLKNTNIVMNGDYSPEGDTTLKGNVVFNCPLTIENTTENSRFTAELNMVEAKDDTIFIKYEPTITNSSFKDTDFDACTASASGTTFADVGSYESTIEFTNSEAKDINSSESTITGSNLTAENIYSEGDSINLINGSSISDTFTGTEYKVINVTGCTLNVVELSDGTDYATFKDSIVNDTVNVSDSMFVGNNTEFKKSFTNSGEASATALMNCQMDGPVTANNCLDLLASGTHFDRGLEATSCSHVRILDNCILGDSEAENPGFVQIIDSDFTIGGSNSDTKAVFDCPVTIIGNGPLKMYHSITNTNFNKAVTLSGSTAEVGSTTEVVSGVNARRFNIEDGSNVECVNCIIDEVNVLSSWADIDSVYMGRGLTVENATKKVVVHNKSIMSGSVGLPTKNSLNVINSEVLVDDSTVLDAPIEITDGSTVEFTNDNIGTTRTNPIYLEVSDGSTVSFKDSTVETDAFVDGSTVTYDLGTKHFVGSVDLSNKSSLTISSGDYDMGNNYSYLFQDDDSNSTIIITGGVFDADECIISEGSVPDLEGRTGTVSLTGGSYKVLDEEYRYQWVPEGYFPFIDGDRVVIRTIADIQPIKINKVAAKCETAGTKEHYLIGGKRYSITYEPGKNYYPYNDETIKIAPLGHYWDTDPARVHFDWEEDPADGATLHVHCMNPECRYNAGHTEKLTVQPSGIEDVGRGRTKYTVESVECLRSDDHKPFVDSRVYRTDAYAYMQVSADTTFDVNVFFVFPVGKDSLENYIMSMDSKGIPFDSFKSENKVTMQLDTDYEELFYKYTLTDAAKDMNLKHAVMIRSMKDLDHPVLSKNYTIASYLRLVSQDQSVDEDIRNCCLAMLTYGAAAQQQFGTIGEGLINEGIPGAEFSTVENIALPKDTFPKDNLNEYLSLPSAGNEANLQFYGLSASLKYEPFLSIYFKFSDMEGKTNDESYQIAYDYLVSAFDILDSEYVQTGIICDGSDAITRSGKNYIKVTLPAMKINDLERPMFLNFNAFGTVSMKVDMDTFMASVNESSDAKMKLLCQSMIHYKEAVKKVLNG